MTLQHLYIHFPYCLYKCHYCDFNSHAYEKDDIPQKRYEESLIRDFEYKMIELQKAGYATSGDFKTIFFGGGTPSLMSPESVHRLLDFLRTHKGIDPDAEITLECNPGTVDEKKLRDFVGAGITRFSLGVQSFHDAYLKAFGRIHTAQEAIQAIQAIKKSGVESFSFDLIFGFPGQTLEEWRSDLWQALTFAPEHLSCYALTAEAGTLYTSHLKKGLISPPLIDVVEDMQHETWSHLEQNGLMAYEISNFSRSQKECQHNLAYWTYQSYLSIGAGGVGQYMKQTPQGEIEHVLRHMSPKLPDVYMNGVSRDFLSQGEVIAPQEALVEALMMGLRLRKGVSIADLQTRFKSVVSQGLFWEQVATAQKNGWVTVTEDAIAPTPAGIRYNNQLVQLFM